MPAKLHTLFCPRQASGRVASYKYIERLPSVQLAPYVSCYWLAEPVEDYETIVLSPQAACPEAVDRVLPDGCTDIIFEQDLNNYRYRILFIGLFDRSFTIAYDHERPVHRFAIRFFPGGAHALMGVPLSEFTNAQHYLDAIWPEAAQETGYRIFEEQSFEAKIRIMEQYLLSHMQTNGIMNNSLMDNLLHRIFISGGRISVQELAAREVISSRQMNRLFYQWIGVGPKKFSEVVRFQAVLNDIRRLPQVDGLSLAWNHGYFDQAHMIRDFKRFYGDSPLTAAKEIRSMSDYYNPYPM
ncbi:MAG: AraC family transcriptional regulator [Paenibacillus sp.]|nr:AraC family transcriptional regulator [Paenibacillus sp.]